MIIGVDAGGSRTRAVAVSMGGEVLARSSSGPANPLATSFEAASNNIAEAVKNLLEILGSVDIEALGIGLAGGTAKGVRDEMRNRVSRLLNLDLEKIFVVGDEVTAHASAFPRGDGVIGILGTGSIVYGRYRGREFWCGGWGYLLGDEGSAYRIGLGALREYLLYLEGRSGKTLLHELVEAAININRREDVLAAIYTSANPRVYIASFAPIVFNACEKGDPLARRIIIEEMSSFADQIIHAIKRLGMGKPVVSFIGSVYERNRGILKPLLTILFREKGVEEIEIVDPAIETPCASALIAAREVLRNTDLEGFVESLIKNCGTEHR